MVIVQISEVDTISNRTNTLVEFKSRAYELRHVVTPCTHKCVITGMFADRPRTPTYVCAAAVPLFMIVI